jgi:hypothetical protein
MVKMEDRIEFLKRMHNLVIAKISLEQGKQGMVEEDTKKIYSELWKGIDVDVSHDPTKERLIKQAWNLKRVPIFAKQEIVRLLEGERAGIRKDVIAAMHQYESAIKKDWPRELRVAVLKAVEEVEKVAV